MLQSFHKEERNIRKYVQVKMFKKKVRLQLDSGSDISIINVQTWKKRQYYHCTCDVKYTCSLNQPQLDFLVTIVPKHNS